MSLLLKRFIKYFIENRRLLCYLFLIWADFSENPVSAASGWRHIRARATCSPANQKWVRFRVCLNESSGSSKNGNTPAAFCIRKKVKPPRTSAQNLRTFLPLLRTFREDLQMLKRPKISSRNIKEMIRLIRWTIVRRFLKNPAQAHYLMTWIFHRYGTNAINLNPGGITWRHYKAGQVGAYKATHSLI